MHILRLEGNKESLALGKEHFRHVQQVNDLKLGNSQETVASNTSEERYPVTRRTCSPNASCATLQDDGEGSQRKEQEVPKKTKKKRKKRKREASGSGESDSQQLAKGEVPNWQKLTAEDIDDMLPSDSDDEVENTAEQTADAIVHPSSRSIPAYNFYFTNDDGVQCATDELKQLHERFERVVLERIAKQKSSQPKSDPPETPAFHDNCKCGHHSDTETESEDEQSEEGESDSNSGSADNPADGKDTAPDYLAMSETVKHSTLAKREIFRKKNHPAALHHDLCFNEAGQMNDGPECRCSWAAKQFGVRHSKYAGEVVFDKCEPLTSTVLRRSTKIPYDNKTYQLEGFSLFFHKPLPANFPQNPLSKWASEYQIQFVQAAVPENFTVKDLELFHDYLFTEIMEMYDLKRYPLDNTDGCPYYHCMPRFVCNVSVVLNFLIDNFRHFVTETEARTLKNDNAAFEYFAERTRGSLVMNANKVSKSFKISEKEQAKGRSKVKLTFYVEHRKISL
ncbi:unnamed protein product [Gongylonema pulchrum]|uniref:Mab-21 domain-containing protein n=1 Tax=Gongylonema pulchrum TaxID=637853 RepID=A0A183CVV9_9BILA|nr:unnamed protein product [Gongylonema pulchrum]